MKPLAIAFLLITILLTLTATISMGAQPGVDIPGDRAPVLSAQPPAQAFQAVETPVIDGDLSDWGLFPHLYMDKDTADFVRVEPDSDPPPEPADASVYQWAMWSGTDLFFGLHIDDDVIVNDSELVWWDDEIELAFIGAFDGIPGGGDDHQYTVNADGRKSDFGIPATPVPIEVGTSVVPDGWDVEVRIAAEDLYGVNAPLVAGKTMAFSLGLHDDDTGGYYDLHMIWAGNATWNQADGELQLVEDFAAIPQPLYLPIISAQ
ncbi:MAG: sugar-binding protein [Chloroflexota bacterium]|nr:sugar-binding protein [Chloroflexota bacterium]